MNSNLNAMFSINGIFAPADFFFAQYKFSLSCFGKSSSDDSVIVKSIVVLAVDLSDFIFRLASHLGTKSSSTCSSLIIEYESDGWSLGAVSSHSVVLSTELCLLGIVSLFESLNVLHELEAPS